MNIAGALRLPARRASAATRRRATADARADPLARRAAARGAAAAGAVPADLGRRPRASLLVGAALLLLRRDRQRPQAPPPRIPSWALGAVRGRGGARGPRVVRLSRRPRSVRRVPVRPGRHQVPRDAHAARRHAARLPRVLPDRHAVLLQPVAARGARRAAGRACWSAATLRGARAAGARGRRCAALARAARRSGRDDPAGHAARRRCCSCSFRASPRRCGACRPTTSAQDGLVRHDGARA